MRTIPGMVVINPADDVEAKAAVKAAAAYVGPVYLRFGRLAAPIFNDATTYKFEMGKGITLTYDDSVPVYLAKIAYGSKKNARGLRDAVRRQVEDQLASALVFHQDQDIHAIALTAGDDGVQLQINP